MLHECCCGSATPPGRGMNGRRRRGHAARAPRPHPFHVDFALDTRRHHKVRTATWFWAEVDGHGTAPTALRGGGGSSHRRLQPAADAPPAGPGHASRMDQLDAAQRRRSATGDGGPLADMACVPATC